MPQSLKPPCSAPGCPHLRPCPVHGQSAAAQAYNRERGSATKLGYGVYWRRVRAQQLRLHPMCEECWSEGRSVLAVEVHHIIPKDQGGKDEFSNLMSICVSHHSRLTRLEHR